MKRLVIATRGSQLALWQANHVKAQIEKVAPGTTVELNVIKTTGDKILDVPLAKVGGKGLFVKEIEQALVDNQADLAVHSMNDVPAELAPGLAPGLTARHRDDNRPDRNELDRVHGHHDRDGDAHSDVDGDADLGERHSVGLDRGGRAPGGAAGGGHRLGARPARRTRTGVAGDRGADDG